MKNGELRQFFISAYAGAECDIGGKVFLIVSARTSSADFLMGGILYKGWSIHFLEHNSEVIDEVG